MTADGPRAPIRRSPPRRAVLGALLAAPAAGPLASAPPARRPPGATNPFSAGVPGGPLPPGWQRVPLNDRKTPTLWALESDGGVTVPAAHARALVSLVMRAASIDLRRTPVAAFAGDRSSLPLTDRTVMRGEAPGRPAAYGVMSDTDDTGAEARAWYGDIEFRPRPGGAAT
jgi:hypothetical protein